MALLVCLAGRGMRALTEALAPPPRKFRAAHDERIGKATSRSRALQRRLHFRGEADCQISERGAYDLDVRIGDVLIQESEEMLR